MVRQARSEATRRKIIDAAVELFSRSAVRPPDWATSSNARSPCGISSPRWRSSDPPPALTLLDQQLLGQILERRQRNRVILAQHSTSRLSPDSGTGQPQIGQAQGTAIGHTFGFDGF